ELLLAPGAVGAVHGEFGIAEQREGEVLIVAEPLQRGEVVFRDAEDAVAVAGERLEAVAEVAGLRSASGGGCGGVEVHNGAGAVVVGEGDGVSVLVGEREGGGGVADGESR